MLFTALNLVVLAASAVAGPLTRRADPIAIPRFVASRNSLKDIEIKSCNATETNQLKKAFDETYELVTTARNYILANNGQDDVYKTYFGNVPPYAVLGAYEAIAHGPKEGVVFRCDNPDGNCSMDGWAGHWRGDNATQETVICELSYVSRKPLAQMCGFGYTVAAESANWAFAGDIFHRLSHIPTVSHDALLHHADGYANVIELAKSDDSKTPSNTHTLQFFALDVYARTVSVPGEGCTGEVPAPKPEPTSSASDPESTEGKDCHTHADGEIHCV